ncbi:MAG: hypothetical protein Q7S00_00800 [bacterium]|nr:hypothetical protein [bacterium]
MAQEVRDAAASLLGTYPEGAAPISAAKFQSAEAALDLLSHGQTAQLDDGHRVALRDLLYFLQITTQSAEVRSHVVRLQAGLDPSAPAVSDRTISFSIGPSAGDPLRATVMRDTGVVYVQRTRGPIAPAVVKLQVLTALQNGFERIQASLGTTDRSLPPLLSIMAFLDAHLFEPSPETFFVLIEQYTTLWREEDPKIHGRIEELRQNPLFQAGGRREWFLEVGARWEDIYAAFVAAFDPTDPRLETTARQGGAFLILSEDPATETTLFLEKVRRIAENLYNLLAATPLTPTGRKELAARIVLQTMFRDDFEARANERISEHLPSHPSSFAPLPLEIGAGIRKIAGDSETPSGIPDQPQQLSANGLLGSGLEAFPRTPLSLERPLEALPDPLVGRPRFILAR